MLLCEVDIQVGSVKICLRIGIHHPAGNIVQSQVYIAYLVSIEMYGNLIGKRIWEHGY